jgi:hypothetical protein
MGKAVKAITKPFKSVKKLVKKAGPVLGMMAANAIAPGSGFALAAGAGIGGLAGGYSVRNSLLMAGTAYALSPGGLGGLGKLSGMAGQGGWRGVVGNIAQKATDVSSGIGQWFNNTGVGQKLTEFGAKMGYEDAASQVAQTATSGILSGSPEYAAWRSGAETPGIFTAADLVPDTGLKFLGETVPSSIIPTGTDLAAKSLGTGILKSPALKAFAYPALATGALAYATQEEEPTGLFDEGTFSYLADEPYRTSMNITGGLSRRAGGAMREMFAYETPDFPSRGPNLLPAEWFEQPTAVVKDGGIINSLQQGGPPTIMDFPRKTGPVNGPGTGTSDSVPAMLSDGEFVMTSRAVKNAGGGSRALGARKMYNLMNNLEQGVA